MAQLAIGQAYSLPIVTVTGTIDGFLPEAFSFSAQDFQNGTLLPTEFGLSLDQTGKTLLLNFTPVPEPSTYALMVIGLGMIAVTLRRRRG